MVLSEFQMSTATLFPFAIGCWMVFFLYWAISALSSKVAKKSESVLARFQRMVPLVVAYSLLFYQVTRVGWLGKRFVADTSAAAVIGVTLTTAGVAFAIWARWHLGANWSAIVSIREQHELIRTGPYRRVRHPIYTGMLLAMAGTALVLGELRGLLAFAITLFAFYWKACKEEAWLTREFGESFEAHAKQTGMFLPKIGH
jgi:protein-S-isoprenylcysteine O-methyltransferase Ste14